MCSTPMTIAWAFALLSLAFFDGGSLPPPDPAHAEQSEGETPEALYPMKEGGKWGYINRQGEIVIKPAFDYANAFHEDRALVRIDKKFGYIDRKGNLVIPATYEVAGHFSEGLAAVTREKDFLWPKPMGELRGPARVGFIDRSGKYVIEPKYFGEVKTSGFHDGRALVRLEALHIKSASFGRGRQKGYLDTSGNLAIPAEYDGAKPFSNGLARVWKDRKAMFIDTAGKVVIDVTHYDYTGDFSDGLASASEVVERGGKGVTKKGFIDREGKIVIPFVYDRVGKFSEGLCAVAVGWNDATFVPKGQEYVPAKWAYIDKKGKVIIELKFWWANPFREGLATVKLEEGGNLAIIDREGNVVIPPKYDSLGSFENGLGRVTQGDRWEEYEAPGITGGRRLVRGKMAYVDKSGKFVWEAEE